MRIAIIGCRPPTDGTPANLSLYGSILRDVDELVADLPRHCVIVSGGAQGVDSRAVAKAIDIGMRWREYMPDYETHGKQAPLIRNETIVTNCDQLYAFLAPWSRGTKHAIGLARKHKVSHVVREYGAGWKGDLRQQVMGDLFAVGGRGAAWRDDE
jgi:hypothetical protein